MKLLFLCMFLVFNLVTAPLLAYGCDVPVSHADPQQSFQQQDNSKNNPLAQLPGHCCLCLHSVALSSDSKALSAPSASRARLFLINGLHGDYEPGPLLEPPSSI